MTIEHAHALPAGTTIEGYRIERLLGEGGFGLTYYAIEEAIDRPVAIKEYLPIGIGARDHQSLAVMPVSEERGTDFNWGLDRFRKEAATLVQFEHPNIVAIHRFFEALGTAYLVMQYIEGVSLEEILGRVDHLPEAELRVILGPLLDGLEEIHKAGYLHRDVKPANIILRSDGSPVLIDFGAARRFRNSNTVPLTSILTEGFAPIEQYRPEAEQGPWTDIYALGAVLYMCVTGRRPLSSTSRAEARALDRPDPLEPAVTAGAGHYSESLLNAIDAALNLNREARPQTVAELRSILTDGGHRDAAPKSDLLPIGPDGHPLPPASPDPVPDADPDRPRAKPTIRVNEADRPLPLSGTGSTAPQTLALKSHAASKRQWSGRRAAAGALLLACLAGGIGYGAWHYGLQASSPSDQTTAGATDAQKHLAAARAQLDAARTALAGGRYGAAAEATAAARDLAQAALKADPESGKAKVLMGEIAGFETALASAREQHVASLLRDAAKAIDEKKWAEASRRIAAAAKAGAADAKVADLRARLKQARTAATEKAAPASPEVKAATREIGAGWSALRAGSFATAVRHAVAATRAVDAVPAHTGAARQLAATRKRAAKLRRAVAVGLDKQITKLRREADTAMQSGDVDGGKRRLERAEALKALRARLDGAEGERAARRSAE